MTRLFTDGAEMGDILAFQSSNGLILSQTRKRSGVYSYLFNNGSDASIFFPNSSEFYFRFGISYNTYRDDGLYIRWRYNSNAIGSMRLLANPLKQLDIFVGNIKALTSTTIFALNIWYLFEVHVKISNSVGIIEVKIDGLLDATSTFTGDTTPDSNLIVNNICFSAGGYESFYLDDIAVNDINGMVDNSWCGDGHIIALTPNGNGDISEFIGNDGDSVDNYLLVNELPSNEDITFVESLIPGKKDLYNLTPCGLVDVNIHKIWTTGRAKDTTTGNGTIKLLVKTEGTEYESDGINLSTSYMKQTGTIYGVNPSTGLLWTIEQLDALQVGIKVVG